jgi:hypothetical protein
MSTAAGTTSQAPAHQLGWTDDGAAVEISLDGVSILTYTYAADDPQAESPRPYFHPVRTPGATW